MDCTWTEFKDTIDWLSKLTTLIVSAIGLIIAGLGISAWKKQLVGQTQYQLAQKILLQVYKIVDDLYKIRHPGTHWEESKQVKAETELFGSQISQREEHWKIIANRFREVHPLIIELRLLQFEANGIIGNEISKSLEDFKMHYDDLSLAFYYEAERERRKSEINIPEKYKSIPLYGIRTEPDVFSQMVDKTVEEIKEILSPILQKVSLKQRIRQRFRAKK